MKIEREIPSSGDVVSIYWCDKCGKNSAYSDYRWPGHQHWEEYNYTLCYECLVEPADSGTGKIVTDRDSLNSPGETTRN